VGECGLEEIHSVRRNEFAGAGSCLLFLLWVIIAEKIGREADNYELNQLL
jgi:hypothetical protein